MLAFVRMMMQVVIARLLTIGPLAAIFEALADAGITEDRIVDLATIVVLGVMVGTVKFVESTTWGRKAVEAWNLILSWGRSAQGPEYQRREKFRT